jgi:hypothetical protein
MIDYRAEAERWLMETPSFRSAWAEPERRAVWAFAEYLASLPPRSGPPQDEWKEIFDILSTKGPSLADCADAILARWPHLGDGGAPHSDSVLLDFWEAHPNAVGWATGYHGSAGSWHWLDRANAHASVSANSLRDAIRAALHAEVSDV